MVTLGKYFDTARISRVLFKHVQYYPSKQLHPGSYWHVPFTKSTRARTSLHMRVVVVVVVVVVHLRQLGLHVCGSVLEDLQF